MRVCTVIATNKIFEAQSGDTGGFDALLANAIAAGYTAEQVAFSVMDDAAVAEILRTQDARRPRTLLAIYADLQALSAGNKTAVWNDLSSGSPKKYLTADSEGIAALDWSATDSGATGASLTAAKLRIAAIYVRRNPSYLVNPAFAPSINIDGSEPVT